MFNNIIINTTEKDLSSQEAVEEYMNIGGWKARRSGKELNFAKRYMDDSVSNGRLCVELSRIKTDWREWIKTIGPVSFVTDEKLIIEYARKNYYITVQLCDEKTVFTVDISGNTQDDILFASALKIVLKKSAYCIGCQVCEANCPHGFISFENGNLKISNSCVKCRKCHDIEYGCLVANSLRLPKEVTNYK